MRSSASGENSSRSERQHKAWGASPRIAIIKSERAREAADSRIHHTLPAASRAQPIFRSVILGLAPQALCCRSLRELCLRVLDAAAAFVQVRDQFLRDAA